MTREEVELICRNFNHLEEWTPEITILLAHDAEQRALIEQQAQELAELREWKRIILGTGTDQEAVIRMAATEYTKTAIQTWKEANDKQAKEIAKLRGVLSELHAQVQGECPSLLNEDSGGDAKLALDIESLLKEQA